MPEIKVATFVQTCFGCKHADVCFLSTVTGKFTVRFPTGDANCINYDLREDKDHA